MLNAYYIRINVSSPYQENMSWLVGDGEHLELFGGDEIMIKMYNTKMNSQWEIYLLKGKKNPEKVIEFKRKLYGWSIFCLFLSESDLYKV